MIFLNRVPKRKDILPVYAVIVLMVYGWTILKFSYYVPSWLYFLNLSEILIVFSYSMAVNLLESLSILIGVVTIAAILPQKWFAEMFVARGAGLSILLLGLMMYVANQFNTKGYYPSEIIHWSPIIFVFMGMFVYLIGRITFLRNAVECFADRTIIFLYISIPFSVLAFIVVLMRNLI
ncbi:MAG: hypothetical protein IH588_16295 [Anaerolineales bacterium]|nr:hypothetical protein [Anaerolineales bacterium]